MRNLAVALAFAALSHIQLHFRQLRERGEVRVGNRRGVEPGRLRPIQGFRFGGEPVEVGSKNCSRGI